MSNPIRRHPWGSRTVLAGLQGRPAAAGPEAELCIGALPGAPSMLLDLDGREISLREATAADPVGLLGPECRQRYGDRLPFELRLLAVERPQAVQVHPAATAAVAATAATAAAAEQGPAVGRRPAQPGADPILSPFPPGEGWAGPAASPVAGWPVAGSPAAGSSAAGASPAASSRAASGPAGSARAGTDSFPRAELLVALEPLTVLVGLRDPWRAGELVDLLDIAPLLPMRRALTGSSAAQRDRAATLEALVRLADWPQRQRALLAAGACDAARAALVDPRIRHDPDSRQALQWLVRLAARYPDDPMVLAPLLLDLVRLEPGESAFVPAGVPHAYLSGVALTASAASGNVVLAGLTEEPVDPAAVQEVVDPELAAELEVATLAAGPHERVLLAPAPEFRLSRVAVPDGSLVTLAQYVPGPQILFCLRGEVQVWCGAHQVTLRGGESAFLGPEAGECVLSGTAELFRVTVGAC